MDGRRRLLCLRGLLGGGGGDGFMSTRTPPLSLPPKPPPRSIFVRITFESFLGEGGGKVSSGLLVSFPEGTPDLLAASFLYNGAGVGREGGMMETVWVKPFLA